MTDQVPEITPPVITTIEKAASKAGRNRKDVYYTVAGENDDDFWKCKCKP